MNRNTLIAAIFAVVFLSGQNALAQSGYDLFQKGLVAERSKGDLDEAIQLYQRIVEAHGDERALVAKALVQTGQCYEKLGRAEARKAYERVIREFADQPEPVRIANQQLKQLDGGTPGRVEDRLLWTAETSMMTPSPDGRHLAFRDVKTGDLVVRELDTGKNRRLTHNTDPLERMTDAASFSPDGKWIVYNWLDKEGRGDLRIIGVDGSRARIVCHPDEQVRNIQPKAWFLDGKRILARRLLQDGTGQIVIVSVADGSVKLLKSVQARDAVHLSPSPDGCYVAYDFRANGSYGQQDISILPVDGGPEVRAIEHPANDRVLGWAPDGHTLLFCSDRRGQGDDAWLIQITDGKPQGLPQLVERRSRVAGTIDGGQFAPDGSFYYAVAKEEQQNQDVCMAMLDPETGKFLATPKPLAERPDQRVIGPDFSPDGKSLAYYAAPMPERSPEGRRQYGPGNIVIRSLETGQERELSLSPRFSDRILMTFLPAPYWAPDGRSILIWGWIETGRLGIYRVNLDTGKLTPVVLADPTKTSPNWQCDVLDDPDLAMTDGFLPGQLSPDGNTLFYTRLEFDPNYPSFGPDSVKQSRFVARDLGTGREREIYPNQDALLVLFALSPDGQHMAVCGETALEIIPTTGGEPRELLKFEGEFSQVGFCWTVEWTPDGRYLLFYGRDEGRRELWRIAAAGGPPERVGELPPGLGMWRSALRIHPDGRQIAFTGWLRQQDRELWVLENFLPDLALPQTLTGADDPQHPFGLDVEVPDPEGDDVKAFAAQVKLSGDDDDWNAPQWCDKVHQGKRGSIDGLWECRDGDNFARWTVQVKTVGDWVYILGYTPDYYLLKARRQGNRLVGRYNDIDDPSSDWGPHVYLIVNDERIDGVWKWKDTSYVCRDGLRRNLLPTVELISPSNDDYYAVGEPVLLKADVVIAQDATVRRVEFLIDGAPVGEATNPPYQFSWQGVKQGHYRAVAKVYDSAGGTERSLPVDVAIGTRVLNRFVAHSEDDAEEFQKDGSIELDADYLKLIHVDNPQLSHVDDRVVGLRFTDIRIPKGVRVKRAYVQFTAYGWGPGYEKADLVLRAELAANAQPFAKAKHNITSRPTTDASVKWSPEPWTVGSERSSRQRTLDLSSLIQEVVNQGGWQEGNALVLIISGSGYRGAWSFDADVRQCAPMLHIEY